MVIILKIENLILGDLKTNCYIISKNAKCLIIDPASDANLIIAACKNYKVEGILVTHHHFDHILALKELENFYNLQHNTHNSKDFKYEVINTPGHTKDSVTFYFREENVMFTGDFLFYHTIGRCDLDTSSIYDMKNSLKKISEYPDDIIILPGHGIGSKLGEEKKLFDNYFK